MLKGIIALEKLFQLLFREKTFLLLRTFLHAKLRATLFRLRFLAGLGRFRSPEDPPAHETVKAQIKFCGLMNTEPEAVQTV